MQNGVRHFTDEQRTTFSPYHQFLSELPQLRRRQHMSSVVTVIESIEPETESPAFLRQHESSEQSILWNAMAHICTNRGH
jgi:hypothetical protein